MGGWDADGGGIEQKRKKLMDRTAVWGLPGEGVVVVRRNGGGGGGPRGEKW